MENNIKSDNVTWKGMALIVVLIIFALIILLVFTQDKDVSIGGKGNPESFVEGNVAEEVIDICEGVEDYAYSKCLLDNKVCNTDDCFYSKATVYGDESYCFNISDESLVAECSAAVIRTNILSDSIIDDDISICEDFEDEDGVAYCRDNYYLAKSINDNDKSYCESIINSKMRKGCLK